MRESTRRKLDWIYEGKRRRALNRIYSGNPSDPTNTRRVIHEETFGRPTRGTEGTPGVWPLQFWCRQARNRIRNRRQQNN